MQDEIPFQGSAANLLHPAGGTAPAAGDRRAGAPLRRVAAAPFLRPLPPGLPLRQPGRPLERSQRVLRVAGTVPSVLPAVPPGRQAPALGPRGQRRPRVLAGPADRHLSRHRGEMLQRQRPHRGRPRPRLLPRHRRRHDDRPGLRSPAPQLGEDPRQPRHPGGGVGPARGSLPHRRPLSLEGGEGVLLPVGIAAGHPSGRLEAGRPPVLFRRPAQLVLPGPVSGRGRLHQRRRGLRRSLLLAPRRQAHPRLRQSPAGFAVPARRLG